MPPWPTRASTPFSGTWSPATRIRIARPRRSLETILGKVHPGAIIVAHANGRGWHTAEALAIAIPKLKEEGYGFVTVSELLAAGKPVIADKCYLNRPGAGPRLARTHRQKSNDVFSFFGHQN